MNSLVIVSVRDYLPDFFRAPSSSSSADCTCDNHLRAEAATFFISRESPRAMAARMGSPYGGSAPVVARALALPDFLLFAVVFLVDVFFVAMVVLSYLGSW